ncbi:lipocalin family protein [Draconibacterium halophilum]|uniref:Lipocalin family protein n=1 Tax=Draconibacterium halophilum TaxID=2706887 RepID=A0A6C0R9D5_9BACT|nr:lipocalin family protein [Draconibacterium halophilum]QIA06496.1 lipocalin family protein [Draconibacterium halophilum]
MIKQIGIRKKTIFQGSWHHVIVLISLISSGLFSSCAGQKQTIDNSVVEELNLQRYLGTWYEIARYDHRFERGLVGVTANYSMRPDGKIKVVNSGYKNTLDGEYTESVGKAKIPDPVNEPAKLKVSFFWFFYGDYYVMELDEDYQWAVIGSSSDKYLWILSRTPQMNPDVYNDLLQRIANRGYDTSELIKVKQKV